MDKNYNGLFLSSLQISKFRFRNVISWHKVIIKKALSNIIQFKSFVYPYISSLVVEKIKGVCDKQLSARKKSMKFVIIATFRKYKTN